MTATSAFDLNTELLEEIVRLRTENGRLATERDSLLHAMSPIATILSRITPADNERDAFATFFAAVRASGTDEERQKHQAAYEQWEARR